MFGVGFHPNHAFIQNRLKSLKKIPYGTGNHLKIPAITVMAMHVNYFNKIRDIKFASNFF